MTIDIEHNESHVAEALADRLFQDKDLPRAEAWATVVGERWQGVEDFAWQVATERDLDNAIGVQLDGLGDILDEPRGGLSDDQYRLFLRAKVLVLKSRGRIEQLIQILEVLGYTDLTITEQPPAHIQVNVCEVVYAHETDRILRLAKAAGVGLLFAYSEYESEYMFQASNTYAAVEYYANSGAGSAYAPLTGGRSAGGLR